MSLPQKHGVALLRLHSHPLSTTLPPTGPAASVSKSFSLPPGTARPWKRRTSPQHSVRSQAGRGRGAGKNLPGECTVVGLMERSGRPHRAPWAPL